MRGGYDKYRGDIVDPKYEDQDDPSYSHIGSYKANKFGEKKKFDERDYYNDRKDYKEEEKKYEHE